MIIAELIHILFAFAMLTIGRTGADAGSRPMTRLKAKLNVLGLGRTGIVRESSTCKDEV